MCVRYLQCQLVTPVVCKFVPVIAVTVHTFVAAVSDGNGSVFFIF